LASAKFLAFSNPLDISLFPPRTLMISSLLFLPWRW